MPATDFFSNLFMLDKCCEECKGVKDCIRVSVQPGFPNKWEGCMLESNLHLEKGLV